VTIFLRDMSHFDGDESLAGYVGTTHKVTEGTSFVDPEFARRMNTYRSQGVKVLGSYHVLHTTNLAGQLRFWLSTLDALTPWWRTFPHWIMQVDAERWPDDNVSATTVKTFASELVAADVNGWKVTYASNGQYRNELTGIVTDLWNADYTSGSTYPGDTWEPMHTSSTGTWKGGWTAYSGKTPILLQWTSTPFDKNAYRGTLDELLAHIEGGAMALRDDGDFLRLTQRVYAIEQLLPTTYQVPGEPNKLAQALADLKTAVASLQTTLAAVSAKLDALTPVAAGDLTVSGTVHVTSASVQAQT
jgi:hypothetical protein